jgi:hypothetical protein
MDLTPFGETPRGLASWEVTGLSSRRSAMERRGQGPCLILPAKTKSEGSGFDTTVVSLTWQGLAERLCWVQLPRLQVFVDHSVLEVYANERVW